MLHASAYVGTPELSVAVEWFCGSSVLLLDVAPREGDRVVRKVGMRNGFVVSEIYLLTPVGHAKISSACRETK